MPFDATFAETALPALYAEFGRAAVYTPQGVGAEPIDTLAISAIEYAQVFPGLESQAGEDRLSYWLQLAEVATVKRGDILAIIGAGEFKVDGEITRNLHEVQVSVRPV